MGNGVGTIEKCINFGNGFESGIVGTGGYFPYTKGTLVISECVNNGSVLYGGIIMQCDSYVISAEINNCYNCGSVSSGFGIISNLSEVVQMNNCYNVGYKIRNDVKSDGKLVGTNSGRKNIKFILFESRNRRRNKI